MFKTWLNSKLYSWKLLFKFWKICFVRCRWRYKAYRYNCWWTRNPKRTSPYMLPTVSPNHSQLEESWLLTSDWWSSISNDYLVHKTLSFIGHFQLIQSVEMGLTGLCVAVERNISSITPISHEPIFQGPSLFLILFSIIFNSKIKSFTHLTFTLILKENAHN